MLLLLDYVTALLPALLMVLAASMIKMQPNQLAFLWSSFLHLAVIALLCSIAALGFQLAVQAQHLAWKLPLDILLLPNLFGAWVSVLVQFLGCVIGFYSMRHLRGEPNQPVYIAALASVLAAVHFLLLANHWLVLIAAWAAIGMAMHKLLVFYPKRPFAQLAAHKKRVADRAADLLLLAAAGCAWWVVGSGSLAVLFARIEAGQSSWLLSLSGVLLTLAVILRTALLPVHGWIIQVMEAPTPVSALLHAGVVNLGGYILVFFAPLLGISDISRWLLIGVGLASAVLGGTVMLTRISIKVHLAWSTLAQMGFMLLECGLGLYAFAALHLLGHSLYKAHSFLSASSVVKTTRRQRLYGHGRNSAWIFLIAPFITLGLVVAGTQWLAPNPWPLWWIGVLALAWAPLLWTPARHGLQRLLIGMVMAAVFTLAATLVEYLPLGASLSPFNLGGWLALGGMLFMYLGFVGWQLFPRQLIGMRHWIYAGFYLDEIYTLIALRLWPNRWADHQQAAAPLVATDAPANEASANA